MRVIILNKKRIGVTMIIVGLMVVLLGFEIGLDSRLKLAMLVQNNISALKSYKGTDFSYKLPSTWTTEKRDFQGKDIRYHNEFTSEYGIIQGFVEVWTINEDLKKFLDKSKEVSTKNNIVKNYNISSIKINNHEGYLVSYAMTSKVKEQFFKSYEYFIKDNNKFIRFSFFVSEKNYTDNMASIFKVIAETLNSND